MGKPQTTSPTMSSRSTTNKGGLMTGLIATIGYEEKFAQTMAKSLGANGETTDVSKIGDTVFVRIPSRNGTSPQTFHTKDNKNGIIFAGHLFNNPKLREAMHAKKNIEADSQVVYELYKLKDRKCVHYLDGSYAFIIQSGTHFYAARDPLGAKPLYFARSDQGWAFASNLKAFLKSKLTPSVFPAGCYFDSESGARRYFKLPEVAPKQINVNEAVELIRTLVTEAIIKNLEDKSEIGIYLTGSLESCIIAAIAAEQQKRIKTFSVGLTDSQDGHVAKRIASWLATDHTHIEITQQDILDNLQKIVSITESFDAPIIRHAVADYFTVKTACDYVNVLLSGEAASELFGGYPYLRPMYPEKLNAEIRMITNNLQQTHLPRWDHITSTSGVEGRVPFTDRRLIHAAFHLPANLKVSEEGRTKWILRRAFSTMLPAWVVDRPDADDSVHAGIYGALTEYAESVFTDEDLSATKSKEDDKEPTIRTKDEMLYWQIWSAQFPKNYVSLVGRTHI